MSDVQKNHDSVMLELLQKMRGWHVSRTTAENYYICGVCDDEAPPGWDWCEECNILCCEYCIDASILKCCDICDYAYCNKCCIKNMVECNNCLEWFCNECINKHKQQCEN